MFGSPASNTSTRRRCIDFRLSYLFIVFLLFLFLLLLIFRFDIYAESIIGIRSNGNQMS
jgi:hypothetical protein